MTANWTSSSNCALCVLRQTYGESTGASSKLDVRRSMHYAWRKPTYQILRYGVAQSKQAFCSAKLGGVLTCPARMCSHDKTPVLSQPCKFTLKPNTTLDNAADAERTSFT